MDYILPKFTYYLDCYGFISMPPSFLQDIALYKGLQITVTPWWNLNTHLEVK